MNKKYVIIYFLVISIILFGYWLKNQMDINFFDRYSLSRIFPFNYLERNEVIDSPVTGIILHDSFNSNPIFRKWLYLWTSEKNKFSIGYDSNGIDSSRCLCIKSQSTKSWAYSHNKFVEVQRGDIFSYDALVKMGGEKNNAFVGIDAFNENMEAIQWYYIKDKISERTKWIVVKKRFTVDDNIKYIRFRLSGNGVGEFRFDNVSLKKEAIARH